MNQVILDACWTHPLLNWRGKLRVPSWLAREFADEYSETFSFHQPAIHTRYTQAVKAAMKATVMQVGLTLKPITEALIWVDNQALLAQWTVTCTFHGGSLRELGIPPWQHVAGQAFLLDISQEQALELADCLDVDDLKTTSTWSQVEWLLKRRRWLPCYLLHALGCDSPIAEALDVATFRKKGFQG